MATVSPFIIRLWNVCSADAVCIQVYGARVDVVSFQTQVVAALGVHAGSAVGSPLIETLESIYSSLPTDITHTPLWDTFYLQLLRKYDLCAHNELYDETLGRCICQPERICIDDVYNTRQNLASQIILYIFLGGIVILLMISTFRQSRISRKASAIRR